VSQVNLRRLTVEKRKTELRNLCRSYDKLLSWRAYDNLVCVCVCVCVCVFVFTSRSISWLK